MPCLVKSSMDNLVFTMLIGLPAVGKSAVAQEIVRGSKDTICLSSDALRKELFGDENVQDKNSIVFEEMHRRTIKALKDGYSVVYDATNLSRKNRRHLLSCLPDGVLKVALIVWARYETCIERDAERERHVGKQVICRMLMHFQTPFYDEGFDQIAIRYTDTLYTNDDYNDWMNCDHDNPHHNNSVSQHTLQVCNNVFETSYKYLQNENYDSAFLATIVMFAAGLHDCGKKFTKSFTNAKGETTEIAHFYDHQNVGSYFALGFEKISSLTPRAILLISWLVNVHMEPFFNSRYYHSLSPEYKSLVDLLHECDVKGA